MSDPIVIAHRGASGYLPEHTLAAKALAYGLGADFLEQDVIATRDAQLVVLHDLYLDDVSDVAQRYPHRRRDDGRYYVIDFDLAELRELNVSERRRHGTNTAMYPLRFPLGVPGFRIATLDEELELVRSLNRSMDRTVGIYPEIKDPQWHRDHGIDLARLLLDKLADYGYRSFDAAAFVQCFDPAELQRVRGTLGCELKLVQLVGHEPAYSQLLTRAGLRHLSEYAQGLGPHYSQLVVEHGATPRAKPEASPLVDWARTTGLQLHPYTFRSDALPDYAIDLDRLLRFFLGEIGVDGVFCDHPDVAVRVRNELRAARSIT